LIGRHGGALVLGIHARRGVWVDGRLPRRRVELILLGPMTLVEETGM
jgi:hypothetical protein